MTVPEQITEDVAHLFGEQPEFAKPTFTLMDLVMQVAGHHVVDPVRCAATAWVLSRFDPGARERWTLDNDEVVERGTRGSLPTRFGLFQLRATKALTGAQLEQAAANADLAIFGMTTGAFTLGAEDAAEVQRTVEALRAGRAPDGFLEAAGVAFLDAQPYPEA